MGFYDSVWVNCPNCNEELEFQSKSGECNFSIYNLESAPNDVLANVNRHSSIKCDCGKLVEVDIGKRVAVIKAQ